ncbi:unnamed protein product, partial [Mesorhabditis spiculigera]
MTWLPYVVLSLCFLGVRSRKVTLDQQHDSFVIYGGELLQKVQLQIHCDREPCSVRIETLIRFPNDTDFSIVSSAGTTKYDHVGSPTYTLPATVIFRSVDTSDPHFVIAFRIVDGEQPASNLALVGAVEDYTDVTLDHKTSAITLVMGKTDHPYLEISQLKTTPDCPLHFFAGSLPSNVSSKGSDSDTLLFKYDGSTYFQTSILKNQVVSVWIPDNCQASFIYQAPIARTLESGEYRSGSSGYFVSYDWAEPFEDAGFYHEFLQGTLTGSANLPNQTIYLKVKANPSINESLTLTTSDAESNQIWEYKIDQPLERVFRTHGQQFSFQWTPNANDANATQQGFAIYYWIPDEIVTTTTSTTTTTTTNAKTSRATVAPSPTTGKKDDPTVTTAFLEPTTSPAPKLVSVFCLLSAILVTFF